MERARCPSCNKASNKGKLAPCTCEVSCTCERCHQAPGSRCKGTARGWVRKRGANWSWKWKCSICGIPNCTPAAAPTPPETQTAAALPPASPPPPSTWPPPSLAPSFAPASALPPTWPPLPISPSFYQPTFSVDGRAAWGGVPVSLPMSPPGMAPPFASAVPCSLLIGNARSEAASSPAGMGAWDGVPPSLPPMSSSDMAPRSATAGPRSLLTHERQPKVTVSSSPVVQQLSASPFKRQRMHEASPIMYERMRGYGRPLAPCCLGTLGTKAGNKAESKEEKAGEEEDDDDEKKAGEEEEEEGDGEDENEQEDEEVDDEAAQAMARQAATLIVVQMNLVEKGDGRLIMPGCALVGTRDSLRVAYSLAMLMERDLARELGPGTLKFSLRGRQFDVSPDLHTFGFKMKGASCGIVAFQSVVQAMTECAFFDQMCSSGAISLTGRVLKIDETRSKLMGALLGEQRAVLLPEENRAEAEPVAEALRTQAPLDMHYVSDVTQVLRTSVIGWQRRTLPSLPTVDVASMDLPMTYDGVRWVTTIEAAVVPGHGEVHITGLDDLDVCMTESLRDAVLWARSNQQAIAKTLQAAVGGRVGLVVDLSSMSYTLQHPWALDCMRPAPGGGMYIPEKSLDVHINISTPVLISNEIGLGAALGVLLASLMTGLPLPSYRKVSVLGSCSFFGVVNLLNSHVNQDTWQEAEGMGLQKLVLNCFDYDNAMTPDEGEEPVDMTRVPTVRVDNMYQVLHEVYRP